MRPGARFGREWAAPAGMFIRASRATLALALVLSPLLGLAACTTAPEVPGARDPLPAQPAGPEPASTPAAQSLETRIHQLINARRTERGLPPLGWDPRIADIARAHSRAMASGRAPFGHQGFDARASAVRSFLPLVSMAENVAYDSRSGERLAARVVVNRWGADTHSHSM